MKMMMMIRMTMMAMRMAIDKNDVSDVLIKISIVSNFATNQFSCNCINWASVAQFSVRSAFESFKILFN